MNTLTPEWRFLSNHAHTLICLAEDPTALMKDIAHRVGITERAAMRIISHLDEAGVLTRQKEGRRNRYIIHKDTRLRHPLESKCSVGSLLSLVLRKD
jgi:DNA-binding MarR family transcriptional regulator